MIHGPFRKQNAFNNSRNDGKFGSDLVDPMLHTLRASDNIFHNCLMHKSLNNFNCVVNVFVWQLITETFANSKA